MHKGWKNTVSGGKESMITTLLIASKRDQAKLRKRKERDNDPLKYAKWWRANTIVNLFKREARRIYYGEEQDSSVVSLSAQ